MESDRKEALAESPGTARLDPTEDGTHLLHITDGDMTILVEIGTSDIGVVLKHGGTEKLMDFEWSLNSETNNPSRNNPIP